MHSLLLWAVRVQVFFEFIFRCSLFFSCDSSGGGARPDTAGAARPPEIRRQAQDASTADRGVLPATEEQHQGVYVYVIPIYSGASLHTPLGVHV